MVGFRFFVHCHSWKDGGYENTHPAENRKEAIDRIKGWNAQFGALTPEDDHYVELLEIFDIEDRAEIAMSEAEIESYLFDHEYL